MEKSKGSHSLNRREFVRTATHGSMGALLGLSFLTNYGCKSELTGMPKRILGRTKLSVSLMGFGCTQVKDRASYDRAVELGINYFHMGDVDPTYNLDACSALLPHRENLVIAYMSHPKDSQALLLEDLDSFLSQSKLGHLDVWFVITPRYEVWNEFNEAVSIAKKAGKIRYAGITTHNLDQDLVRLTAPESVIDVVMTLYNYLSPGDVNDKLEQLTNAGLGIIPMKPLAGRFDDKTTMSPDPMLRWLAADERIHTIPVMMTSSAQVKENVASIKTPLTQEDQDLLQEMYSYHSSRFCRMCRHCTGKCPENLAVSDLVRTSMYLNGYADTRLAGLNYSSIPIEKRLISCDLCSECSVTCPNGVDIRERILEVNNWLA